MENFGLNPTNNDYLFNQLGDSPNNSKNSSITYAGTPSGYTYVNFKQLQSSILATDNLSGYASGIGSGSIVQLAKMSATDAVFNGSEVGATEGYSFASTPFIQSQIALGQKDLFRFHTISHGTELNRKYKISIANLREPSDIDGEEQYSTFSVLVRDYDSNDNSSPLEVFNGVNLDPTSPQYISRIIGDRYPQYNETLDKVELLGNYPNLSNYIRVEVKDVVASKALSPKISPKGFAAIYNPFKTASLNIACTIPSASYEGVQQLGTDGTYNASGNLGWKSNEKSFRNI